MRTPSPGDLVRNLIFLVLVPGVVGGLIPWIITRYESFYWERFDELIGVIACVLIIGGIGVLLYGVWQFATEGRGTPAPVAPAARLVREGPYRYVRNPMYIAVAAIILGQVLLFFTWWALAYLALFSITVMIFAKVYEEKVLRRQFGEEYDAYAASVPAWIPRPPKH